MTIFQKKSETCLTGFCLPCICCVSCAQLSFTLEPDHGLCNTHDECACESSLSIVTSSVQTESKCCVSTACGWCVAQKLLLTRGQTSSPLASQRSANSHFRMWEVSDQHFQNSSYSPFEIHIRWEKVSRAHFSVDVLHFPGHHGHLAAPATFS